MADYKTIIGLEVHAELLTESKIFCGCSTKFGEEPNTSVCPVCLGLPGVLPVLNKKAVEYVIRTGIALNCEIAEFSKFDRKNYYYPDLPKNYQISQYDLPIALNGYLEIEVGGEVKRIRIKRVHLEEDAGKTVHCGDSIFGSAYALEDYNRTGVPLMEIVSEPDITSAEEAKAYLERLKTILQYAGVSDCRMEEGSLRCDANVNIKITTDSGEELRTSIVEVKNMNSFRAVEKAMAYEANRQFEEWLETRTIAKRGKTTAGWNEAEGKTFVQRSKEEAHDYRYFPEPDLVPLEIDRALVERIASELPEMPGARKKRYIEQHGLPEYDAELITSSKHMADFYEEAVKLYGKDPKTVSNWVMGEFSRLLNVSGLGIEEVKVTPSALAEMLKLIDDGAISGKIAKTVFEEMFSFGKAPRQIVEEKGLSQISDEGEIIKIVEKVIADNPQSVADFKAGKEKAIGFLVGQVMKLTQGRANPGMLNKLLKEKLSE